MADDSKNSKLPEERQFQLVLWGTCLAALLFLYLFVTLTLSKARLSPRDITANWFAAWGAWAGGLATGAAFLIAAFSISVASAQARADRQEAARIRENNDMAQARLLVIFKVEMPGGLESLATFRVENRSKDLFFDVTVPYVDSPDNSAAGFERRTPELVEAGNRLHEFLPSGELLTPYRSNTEHEAWFTLVTVHTANWRDIKFAVEYTDAGGRRWRQHLGGQIEPIFTAEAIPIREADRFQPSQQIRRLTPVEARRLGGQFARDLPPLESDEEYLEVLEPIRVARWSRIQRVGNITERTPSDSTGQPQTAVTFTPAAPPFWEDHFRAKVGEAGITIGGGQSDGRSQSIYLRLPDEHPPAATVELIDAAIQYANDLFEANELAAARRALQARRGGHT